MKNSTIIIFITFTLLGCRVNRQRQEELSLQTREVKNLSQSSDRFLWQQIDSNQSYWMLQADSVFYYHPQYGFWGTRGRLVGSDMQIKKTNLVMEKDSQERRIHIGSQLESQVNSSSVSKENWNGIIWGVASIVILSVLIFLGVKKSRQ